MMRPIKRSRSPSRTNSSLLFATLLAGCEPYVLEVVASAGVSTVANVRWSEPADARSRIIAENAEGVRIVGDWQPPGGGHLAVVGLKADTTYDLFIEPETGESGTPVAFTTGSLPTTLPTWTTTGTPGWRGFAVTSLQGAHQWAIVLDETGDPVWFREISKDGRLVRARARMDGRGLWVVPTVIDDKVSPSDLIGIDWNGNEIERHTIEHFSHDYVEVEPGIIAFLLYEPREIDGILTVGNTITEIALETGEQRQVFSSYDLWGNYFGEDAAAEPWAGGNAIDFDAESDMYGAGFRQLDAIIEVNRESSEVGRQLGGPQSDFTFPTEGSAPHQHHQFQWFDDGILVFDNRENDEYSRVTEFALSTPSAEVVWTHQTDPPLWIYALGDVDRANDGSTFITWTTSGILEDVDPAGDTRWSLSTEFGAAFGFLERTSRLGGFTRP